MNAQFQVAQLSGSPASGSNAAPTRIFRLSKPLGDQAVVVNLGYDQKAKVDFSAIANEKITLVHVGDKLIILFDNKSTVTVEPFFDSRHDALGNLSVEVAPGREVSVNEFASLFPITTDQSVLPAAGEGGNAQGSGANFSDSAVDPLGSRNPLDLLGQEELGNFRVNFDTAALTVNDVPQALSNSAVVFDEDGLKGGLLGGIGDLDPGSNGPISASGILAHSYGSDGAGTTLLLLGTPPAGFIYTLSADRTVLTVSQFQNGVPVDVIRISLSNTTDGAYTIEQLHAIDHSAGNNENDQTFTFAYEVRDSNGDAAQGSLSLTVDDDSPEVGENASIVFDEDALAFGNLGGIGDVDPATNGPISASGTLTHSYGADGAGTTLLTTAGAPEGFTYAVNGTGTVLTVSQMQDGVNVTVLQVVLTDRISGNYTVTQLHAINHASGQDENNQSFTFNYNVTDHDGDTTGGTLTLTVNDDTPIALSGSGGEGNEEGSGSFTFATVYEDGLTNLNSGNQSVGNAEGGFQTTSVVITASDMLGLVSFGADQPGTFSLNPGASAPTLFSHGDPVTYSVANGTLTASAGGRTVFTLHDNGDQTFTFVLKDQLDHNGFGDYETLTINLASAFVATDSDGDSVVLNGTFNIRVENDVPVQNYSATVSGSVQEDALTNANSNHHSVGNPEGSGQTTVAEGELSALVKVGADETGTFSLDSTPGGLPSLTSKGAAVLYTVSGDTLTGYVEGGGGGGYQAGSDRAVFTLQITPGGQYKFTLLDQVDHLPNSPANNDSQTLTLNLGSAIKFTDADGDSITLSGGLSISVEDDVPVLTGASIARTVDEDDINTAWSQGTSPSDGSGDGSLTEGSTGAAIVTGSLAGLVSTGADEPGTFAFSADAIGQLTALGLFSKQTAQGDGQNGKPLFYQTSSGGPNEIVITGYEPNPHGNPVLSLTLNTVTGAYEFRLFDELIHVTEDGQNTDLRSGLPVDGIQASVPNIDFGSIITFTDRDGDQVTLSGKFTVTITDDVPQADIDIGRGSVTIDETPGNQADDTTSSSVRNLFANLEATFVNGARLVGDDPDVSGDNNGGNSGNGAIAYAHSDFAVVVNDSVIGSDSPPYPHQFTLSVTNGNGTPSGLFVTDGSPINLSMRDGLVIGTVVGGQFDGKVAFAIAIGSDGEVSVAQYLSIKHDDRGDSNESNDNGSNSSDASPDDPVTIQQTLNGKITATLTVTDSDGDQSSNSVNIGNRISFLDDGPSVEAKVVHDAHLIHDETPGIDAADDDVAGTTAFAGSTLASVFSAVDTPRGDDPHVTDNPIGYALTNGTVFSFTTQNYGADGAAAVKPIQYELVLSSNNVHSGLKTTDGRDIHLFKEGNLIVGRYEVGGNNLPDGSSDEVAAFAISIDPATGQLAMVQYVSLHHPNDGNPDDTVQLDDGTLSVKVTLTDGDGDPASDTVDISGVIQFEDDGPTLVGSATLSIAVDEDGLATGNADAGRTGETLGTGSAVASGAAGALNALVNFGADGPGSAAFSLAAQSSPVNTGLESKGGDVFIVSDGTTLRGYVNLGGNSGYQAGTDREVFTLTVGSNGSYTFTLKDQIDHPSLNGDAGDNTENLLATALDLSKYIIVTDGDGDSIKLATGAFTVQIQDDIPVANADIDSVTGSVQTLNFDDVPLGDNAETPIASPYHGFNFIQAGIHNPPGSGPFANYAPHSGSNLAFIGEKNGVEQAGYAGTAGDPISIAHTDGSRFTALGAWFSSNGSEPMTITVSGYVDGILVSSFSQEIHQGGAGGPTYVNLSVLGSVDKITLDAPNYFGFDDFSYTDNSTATGNVITGAGTTNNGEDLLGADGAKITGVVGVTVDTTSDGSHNFEVAGQYGTLVINENGAYIYTRFDGAPIVANDVFTYTLTDGDGDSSTATLTIGISDDGVTFSGINAQDGDIIVSENDLLASRGVDESAGSSPDSGNLTKNGTFAISATNGLDSLVIDGHAVITNGAFTATSFTTATGNTFAITGFDGTNVSYSYTLVDNEQHASVQGNNNLSENLSIVATDADGDSAASTIKIVIIDDVPTAAAGAALTVAETDGVTSGTNLLLNDIKGADGATVTAVDIGSGLQSIAPSGTTTLSNVNGTYTFQADGTWTFDPSVNASNSSTTGNFIYEITDGDGDTSTAEQVVNITNANALPTAGSQSITVDEDGLTNGIATPQPGDVAGSAITQTGTLIHDFNSDGPAASDPINFSPMDNGSHATLVGLSSGGAALKYYWDAAGDTLYASTNTTSLADAQSTAAFKVVLNTATGAYTYTQLKPVDHPGHDADGANNGPETSYEDNLNVNLTYQVKDSNGDAVTGTLSVTINDDSPAAAPIVKTVTEGASDTNILLILDRSGSMGFDSGVSGYATRLDLLKAAANQLLDQYDAAGDVRVQIIKFNDNAQKQGSVWLSVADAKTYINGLTADDGTDYDDAAALAPDAFDDPGKLTTPGVRNVSYFISDGQPEPTSEQVSGSELTDWINFVNANDIVSYAIGLGSSAPDTYLDPLAYDGRGTGSGTDTDALIVTNLNQLQSTLIGTVNPSISGSVIDGSIPTSFGADGGYVKSIAIDGKTYSYNPTNDQITETGSGQNGYSFNTANNKLTITFTGSAGESFVIDLDDGTYVYTPPTNIVADFSRPFTYTLTDNDGDTVSSTLTINIDNVNGAPVLDANASPFLVAITEDAVAPSGPVGTLVSSLVDLTGGGGINNVTDADGTGLGIAITATNSANGTWFYSTNGGTTWTAVGAVSNSSALLLEADGNTRLYFQPAANFSGTVTDGITFRAWDETTGTAGTKVDTSSNGGSSAFSSATDAASVTVNAANDAPVITAPNAGNPVSISVAENTTFVTDVNATDVDAGTTLTYSIIGGLDAAKFTINPSTGVLSFISAPNFEAPTDNGGNNVYDVIVQVSDGSLTDTQSISVTVTDANDPPVGVADRVYTNASSSGNGTTIVLQNSWLVKNDTDIEGNSLNVATASNGNDVDQVNEGPSTTSIRVDVSQGDTGNFTYTATDGTSQSGSTTVTVHRGSSDSTITGSNGNDILIGAGNTAATLDGGAGSDFVTGGGGADTLVADQNDYLLNGGGGNDTLRVSTSFTSTSDAQVVNIENVLLTAATTVNLSNQTEGFTITGSSGADSITAGSGDDTIVGAQNDTLLAGGGGADTLEVSASFTSTGDGQITGIETVELTAAATLNLANQSEGFAIFGSGGSDTITGGAGVDTITGGAGGDRMTGGSGAGVADTFVIGSGQTTLSIGGSGNNGTISGYDTITDFNLAVDKLSLNGTPFTASNTSGTNGSNSSLTIGGNQISSHAITNGIIRFDDSGTFSTALTLDSTQDVAAVVDYLRQNDLGSAGATVAFTATIGGVNHTYIYQQVGSGQSDSNDILVDLENVTLTSGGTSLATLIGNGHVDPIVLDLGDQGISFSSISDGVQFDINADGASDQVAWTANGQDGILALDVDGSGKIEGGKELFTPNFNGGQFADGIAALASLDGNHDGVIDGQDQAFGDLVVWQDANHNGVSETGELAKLGDLGITSISLSTTQGGAPIDGQHIAGSGSFTYADGSTGTFVEVDLDASLGKASAQPDSHPAEDHDLSVFAAVAAEIDYGGGDLDLSGLQQPGADHAPAPQTLGAEAGHAGVDAGVTTPAAITIMHEQAALAMQLAAS
jgi:T1SS-143 domain-containing protein